VAAAVIFAQLIGAAHVHSGFLIKGIFDRTRTVASEAACPICAFQVHTPTSTNSVSLPILPFLYEAFVATARRSRLLCAAKPQLFGRAPPASI
jgi:hypothetical protein